MSIERPFFPTETAPSPERGGDNVSRRLAQDVGNWRAKYALIIGAVIGGSGMFGATRFIEAGTPEKRAEVQPAAAPAAAESASARPRPEAESELGIAVNYEAIREMDPEATPRRIGQLMSTLPEGFLDGVDSLDFYDVERRSQKVEGGKVAATAFGGEGAEKTKIVCWKEAKELSSRSLWTEFMLHEIFHANDWRTVEWFNEDAGKKWRKDLERRVRAKDRFRSGYIEAIAHEDKKFETMDRALEYWAEIGEAYLSGRDLPEADAKLVQEFLEVVAPGFDRDAALEARNAVLDDMEAEEASKTYDSLPEHERASIDAWMHHQSELEVEPADPFLQREGRKEVLNAFQRAYKRLGQSKEALDYLLVLTNYYHARQNLFEAKASGDPAKVRIALGRAVIAFQDLDSQAAELPDAEDIRREIDGVMGQYGVWVGGETHQMKIEANEYGSWTESQQNYWRVMPFNWDVPFDPLDQYLNQKSFEPPAEKPGEDEGAEDEGIEMES